MFSFGLLFIAIIAFFAEFIDSSLGMGYGTALTPILILLEFDPFEIVPSILLSEFLTGIFSGFVHQKFGNVDLKPKTMNIKRIINMVKEKGIIYSFNDVLPKNLRLALMFATFGVIGNLIAIIFILNISKIILTIYIGLMVFSIGIYMFLTLNKKRNFSWKKLIFTGILASFNKVISGGGYGPLVTGGQILSGVNEKNAIAITSFSESFTCLIALISYITITPNISFRLAPYLLVGAILSVPLSAGIVKKMKTEYLKAGVVILTILLGISTLAKIFIDI